MTRSYQSVFIALSGGVLVGYLFSQQEQTVARWLTNSNIRKDVPKEATVQYSNYLETIPSSTASIKSELAANQKWPSLESLVDGKTGNIKKDVQFILDFAIIAHPKCATSFTQRYLASHEEIAMHGHEIYAIRSGDPAQLVQAMYELRPGPQYKRGFKSPKDVSNANALNVLAKYFPKTKLIIGLRHPVLWFESFYNFRLRQYGFMPPVDDLIGTLEDDMNGVSTDEARFHANLDNLRKTNRTKEELDLIGPVRSSSSPKLPNPVFLYEISQLYDSDETRKLQYVSDLQTYLGLKQDMKELKDDAKEKHSNPPAGTIDICEHDKVRGVLMEHAVAASIWIREYFLISPDVTVSSRDHFIGLLEGWITDPCIARLSEDSDAL